MAFLFVSLNYTNGENKTFVDSKEVKQMFESFDSSRNRYASVGVVSSLPDELIDSIWFIIDLDLKGVIPLENILTFDLIENRGKVTMHFSQAGSNVEMDIDLPFAYSNQFPAQVYAYDDGTRETILLPSEIRQY
ncbi:hypothetical protein SE9_00170 [Enterococcus faecium EnGen0126]|nr:hypothetical protein SE9_00170 [Enterococcus faecium EnGen0126]